MMNDTAVFDALRVDPNTGAEEWTGRTGTRQAITRDGFVVDAASLAYCPHEWLDEAGYVDPGLARKHPYNLAL